MALGTAEKIFVDVNDEINFIVEKILRSDKDRIILVVPQNALIVSSLVSLKILARQVWKSDKVLIFVTEDRFGLGLAERAGLTAASKISNIVPELWETAQIDKQENIASIEEKKRILLEKRGVKPITTKLPEVSPDDQENVEGVEDSDYELEDGTTALDAETNANDMKEETEMLDEEVEYDRNEEGLPEDDQEIDNEEVKGPIQRTRLKGKMIQVGSFQVFAGGDINSAEGSKEGKNAIIGTIASDDDTNMEEDVPLRSRHRKKNNDRDLSSLTGRDWSKYTQNSNNGFSLAKMWPMSLFSRQRSDIEDSKSTGGRLRALIVFVLILIAAGAGGVWLLANNFSSVEIKVKLKKAEIPIDQQISANISVTSIDEEEIVIPARVIPDSPEKVSISASGTPTGEGESGNKASGLIEIWNKQFTEVTLAKGTVLESISTGLKYTLTEDIVIPAAVDNSDGLPTYGGLYEEHRIDAQVYGEDYNVEINDSSNTDFRISGYNTDQLIGKRLRAISGGTTQKFKTISQEEFETMEEELTRQLTDQGKIKIKNLVPDGYTLLVGSEEINKTNSYSTPAVGEKVEENSFSVTIEAEITALAVKNEHLETAIGLLIQRNSGIGDEFRVDTLSEAIIADVVRDGNEVTFKVTSQGSLRSKLSENDIKELLSGKDIIAAQDILTDTDDVESYKIEYIPAIIPEFLRKIPGDFNRIKIIFQ